MSNRKKTRERRLEQMFRNGSYKQRVNARTQLQEMESREMVAQLEGGLATIEKLKGITSNGQ
jgi:hypothetical protein